MAKHSTEELEALTILRHQLDNYSKGSAMHQNLSIIYQHLIEAYEQELGGHIIVDTEANLYSN